MKNTLKRVFAFLCCLVLLATLSVPVFAAAGDVTVTKNTYAAISFSEYTAGASDAFDGKAATMYSGSVTGKFEKRTVLTGVTVTAGKELKNLKISGSEDGANWIVLYEADRVATSVTYGYNGVSWTSGLTEGDQMYSYAWSYLRFEITEGSIADIVMYGYTMEVAGHVSALDKTFNETGWKYSKNYYEERGVDYMDDVTDHILGVAYEGAVITKSDDSDHGTLILKTANDEPLSAIAFMFRMGDSWNNRKRMAGVKFEGSVDGETWTEITTLGPKSDANVDSVSKDYFITVAGVNEKNLSYIEVDSTKGYRYVKITSGSAADSTLSTELTFGTIDLYTKGADVTVPANVLKGWAGDTYTGTPDDGVTEASPDDETTVTKAEAIVTQNNHTNVTFSTYTEGAEKAFDKDAATAYAGSVTGKFDTRTVLTGLTVKAGSAIYNLTVSGSEDGVTWKQLYKRDAVEESVTFGYDGTTYSEYALAQMFSFSWKYLRVEIAYGSIAEIEMYGYEMPVVGNVTELDTSFNGTGWQVTKSYYADGDRMDVVTDHIIDGDYVGACIIATEDDGVNPGIITVKISGTDPLSAITFSDRSLHKNISRWNGLKIEASTDGENWVEITTLANNYSSDPNLGDRNLTYVNVDPNNNYRYVRFVDPWITIGTLDVYTKGADATVPATVLKGWEGDPFVSEIASGEIEKDSLTVYQNKNETPLTFAQMTDGAAIAFDGDKATAFAGSITGSFDGRVVLSGLTIRAGSKITNLTVSGSEDGVNWIPLYSVERISSLYAFGFNGTEYTDNALNEIYTYALRYLRIEMEYGSISEIEMRGYAVDIDGTVAELDETFNNNKGYEISNSYYTDNRTSYLFDHILGSADYGEALSYVDETNDKRSYITVKLAEASPITAIALAHKSNDTNTKRWNHALIEVSADGETWVTLKQLDSQFNTLYDITQKNLFVLTVEPDNNYRYVRISSTSAWITLGTLDIYTAAEAETVPANVLNGWEGNPYVAEKAAVTTEPTETEPQTEPATEPGTTAPADTQDSGCGSAIGLSVPVILLALVPLASKKKNR
ncbi:MAG: discoidin domain-containing protein [Clostridia bacterium]|nr:discoidin domain-containing protein [Clostridia bacterium]